MWALLRVGENHEWSITCESKISLGSVDSCVSTPGIRSSGSPVVSKRVIFVTGATTHSAGTRVMVTQATRLAGLGWDPSIVFPGGGELATVLRDCRLETIVADISWPHSLWPFHFLREVGRVARQIRPSQSGLIHCVGENDYLFSRHLGRRTNMPVCCRMCLPRDRVYCQWMFGRKPSPSRIFCVSHAMAMAQKESLDGLLPIEHIRVTPNIIDTELFQPMKSTVRDASRAQLGIARDRFCIGVVGMVKRYKQCHHVLDVITRLLDAGIDVEGALIGPCVEDDYLTGIMDAARGRGLDKRLVVTGAVSDMPGAYAACDVVASFSIGETFGMAITEAMACGIPVVAYACPALVEVIGDGGFVVKMNDIDAFSSRCIELASSASTRLQIGRVATDRVRATYGPESILPILLKEYAEILEESRLGS